MLFIAKKIDRENASLAMLFIYLFILFILFIGILLSYKSNKREVTRTKKKKKIAKRE